jgi:hypothetical protein
MPNRQKNNRAYRKTVFSRAGTAAAGQITTYEEYGLAHDLRRTCGALCARSAASSGIRMRRSRITRLLRTEENWQTWRRRRPDEPYPGHDSSRSSSATKDTNNLSPW